MNICSTWKVGSISIDAAKLAYSRGELRKTARRAARTGFRGGAQWMAEVMGVLRERPVKCPARAYNWFGFLKYFTALGVCTAVLVALLFRFGSSGWLVIPVLPLIFYAIEVQTVFLFPLLIDESPHPWRASRRMVVESGGTVASMVRVIRTAIHMLGTPLLGRNPMDTWCEGCLAVLIWYEEVRSERKDSNRATGAPQDRE